MRKNAITSALSGKSKIFLLVCLAAAFAADLAVFVTLLVLGAGAEYWAFPLVFLLADALFIVQAAFSNFRFSYTVWQIVIYCLLTAAMLISTVVCNICVGETAFTDTASALLIATHAVALFAVIFGYVYAARSIAGGKTAQTFAVIVITALCVSITGLYGAFLGFGGYFGQGGGIRPVKYAMDADGNYIAVGTVGAKGDTVVIPEEFNGKKVSAVYSSVFVSEGVKDIYLECSADVTFLPDNLVMPDGELKIFAEKDAIDRFKAKFYNLYSLGDPTALELANKTVPYGLDNDEVYVTFAYSSDSFENANGKPLPTWYGKKGDLLDMSYFDEIPYAKYSDKLCDEDLAWCWNSVKDKVILSDFSINGGDNNGKVNESLVEYVEFERIYAVYPGESNDLLHSTDVEFVYTQTDETKPYKLTTAKNADKITQPFKRDGFSVKWSYAVSATAGYRTEFDSLSSALEYKTDRVFWIFPKWKMNAPQLNLSSDLADNTVVYGDGVTLTAEAAPPADGFKLEYLWKFNSEEIEGLSGSVYGIDMARRTHAGEYLVNVKATTEGSSLYANTVQTLNLKVDRRPVTVEWELPSEDELVYDNTLKKVTCKIKDGDVITFNGVKDDLGLSKTKFFCFSAGSTTLRAVLTGNDEDNYVISDGSDARTIVIKQAPLTVTVHVKDKYYDGETNTCTYEIEGGIGDDKIEIYMQGLTSSAGTHRVTCRLGINRPSTNYYIAECNEPEYTIFKQPLVIEWIIAGDDGFVYDGERHDIVLTAKGTQGKFAGAVCNGYVAPDEYSLINAGTHTVGTYILNSNYEVLSGATHTFNIKKRVVNEVRLINKDKQMVYSGYEHTPDCVITGVGKDAGKTIYVTGRGEVNAGTYTFKPDGIEADYAGNYELGAVDYSGLVYTIKPATAYVIWNGLEITYDGKAHTPAASAGDLKIEVKREGAGIDAGTYKVTAQIADEQQAKNYVLANSQADMIIKKAKLNVKPDSKTVRAGQTFSLTYTVTGFANGENAQSVGLNVTEIFVSGHKGETILPAGRYNIIVMGTQVLANYDVDYAVGILTVLAEGK